MFAQSRTYSHQSSRSISTADYNGGAPVARGDQRMYSELTQERSNRPREQSLPRSLDPLHPVYGVPAGHHSHTQLLPSDESLSGIHSSDGADTETDFATAHRSNAASLSARGKREQVRTAKKLTKMGYPADQAAVTRSVPVSASPPAGSKRFGITRFMQTFKGKV